MSTNYIDDIDDIEIQQFIPQNVVQVGNVVGIFGPRQSGKSIVCENICRAIAPMTDCFVVIDPDPNRSNLPPKSLVLREWDADFMDRLLRSQQEAWRQTNTWLNKDPSERRDLPPKKGLNLCVVIAGINFSKVANLESMLLQSRRFHVTVIIECQLPLDLKPLYRAQLDYTICSTAYKRVEQVHVHQAYFDQFETFREFMEISEYLQKKNKYYWVCGGLDSSQVGWFQSECHLTKPTLPKPPKRKRTIRLVDATTAPTPTKPKKPYNPIQLY